MAQWWGLQGQVHLEAGREGWFDFPTYGRHAVRIEVVEAPAYLAWRWSADERDVPLAEVRQPLTTEWLFVEKAEGGTELQLLETGFLGPDKHADNTRGWAEILSALVRLVDGEEVTGKAGAAGPETREAETR
jgi:uncharacterized protein YndB with AHSA1/START domain